MKRREWTMMMWEGIKDWVDKDDFFKILFFITYPYMVKTSFPEYYICTYVKHCTLCCSALIIIKVSYESSNKIQRNEIWRMLLLCYIDCAELTKVVWPEDLLKLVLVLSHVLFHHYPILHVWLFQLYRF